MLILKKVFLVCLITVGLIGCSNVSKRDVGLVGGGVVGGAAGHAITGSTVGTVGGAVGGAYLGSKVGESME